MILRLIIAIILVIILFFINNTHFLERFTLKNDGYEGYRMGDYLAGQWKSYDMKGEGMRIVTKFPNSICAKYYKKTKNLPNHQKWGNSRIISEIVNDYIDKPFENDIVVHLRIGDVLKIKDGKIIYLKHKGFANGHYGIDLQQLQQFCLKNKNKFDNFIFVYGIHNNSNQEPSKMYLNELRQYMNKNNIKFEERHHDNPDIDFAYMCKSKHFLPSGSNFSKQIQKVVEYNNNNIYKL